MEPTYTILGPDGNQYGPVTAEQIRGWAREGRVVAQTQVWRSDTTAWVPAASLPEIGLSPATAAPPTGVAVATPLAPAPIPVAVPTHNPELERRIRSGAGWFYWIAAFSVINSIITATGSGWGFALGLGITHITDAIVAGADGAAKAVGMVLSLGAAGLVALFGFFAGKRHGWAFIVGMIVLGLDTVLTGFLQMWLSLAIHAYALFSIFGAYRASRA